MEVFLLKTGGFSFKNGKKSLKNGQISKDFGDKNGFFAKNFRKNFAKKGQKRLLFR